MNTWVALSLVTAGCLFLYVAPAEGCPDPGVDVAPPLEPGGASSFDQKKVAKAMKKKTYRPLKTALQSIEKVVDDIVGDTTAPDSEEYPACAFSSMCESETIKAENWKIAGENCWLLEAVAWTTCTTKAPDVKCGDTETGFTCKNVYTLQNVWVYCRTKKNPIRQMTVPISTGCRASLHDCSSGNPN